MAKKTVVTFVLDQTGSMELVRDATISGFNEYLAELRKRKEPVSVALTVFNSINTEHRSAVKVQDMEDLTTETYVPNGMTPLYDAIAGGVNQKVRGKPSRLCVIMTDGLENASRGYNRDSVFALIKEKERDGWAFVYLGANQDAWAVASSIGIAQTNSLTFDATNAGVPMAASVAAGATIAYAASGGTQKRDLVNRKNA